MIAFDLLSPLARAFFALWALLICLSAISSAILSAVKKRFFAFAAASVLFTLVYLLWQVIFDFSLFRGTEKLARISSALGGLPVLAWLVGFAVLTVAAAVFLGGIIRRDQTAVSPASIKRFLDQVPCGICCWRENGRVLFSNICMNRLCLALTGEPLLNGVNFRSAADGIRTAEGKVWRFSCREMILGGEILHEMIAADITAEYAKTAALERDKAELSQLNRDLREYYSGIDDTVRRQEILQAKVNIHDEMNRLMLSTMAAESEDAATLDRIFSLWEQNTLLLCMEAQETADAKAMDRIEKLAESLKIRLIRRGEAPAALTEKQRRLFFSAAQEAIANAAKHAFAKTMEISFEEREDEIVCVFRNDGDVPADEVRFAGGLANLSLLAEKQGASLTGTGGKTFSLCLTFPKNQPNG